MVDAGAVEDLHRVVRGLLRRAPLRPRKVRVVVRDPGAGARVDPVVLEVLEVLEVRVVKAEKGAGLAASLHRVRL